MNISILALVVIQGALSFQSLFQSLLESWELIESSKSPKSYPCNTQRGGMRLEVWRFGSTSLPCVLECQAWVGGAK